MLDSNWDLINGEVAHEIEVLNHANQINVMEALVRYFTHHAPPEADGCPVTPNSNALRELHRTGTLFLLESPGEFRVSEVHIANGIKVVHTPPSHTEIPRLMAEFDDELSKMWAQSQPLDIAAWALWRINFIHPFKNGNGRAARAFSYACLCLKYGFMLPGSPTVIQLIMMNRPQFQEALGQADQGYHDMGSPNLAPMKTFLEQLLIQQLTSIADTEETADQIPENDAAQAVVAPPAEAP